jgi:prepilin-type N-terminal cleavage/methylation domain-containing protein
VKRNSNSLARSGHAKGFSLMELMISMFVLVLILSAVFEQINTMQRKSGSEAMKVDLSQEAREFVDQTVRDLHMAGYPGKSMYSNQQAPPSKVAAGLVSVSPTQILLEGDVNNDGTVYSVNIYYQASDPNDPNCPCIRRSAIAKIDAGSLSQPINPYYTETEHVFPPGTGAGQSGEDLFAYYDQNGEPVIIGSGVDISTGAATISTIKTVKINLSLLTNMRDPVTNDFVRTSLAATARLNQ